MTIKVEGSGFLAAALNELAERVRVNLEKELRAEAHRIAFGRKPKRLRRANPKRRPTTP